ncbi:MAG: hypothetical protein ACK5ZU_01205 [Acidobacteriota bacterium]
MEGQGGSGQDLDGEGEAMKIEWGSTDFSNLVGEILKDSVLEEEIRYFEGRKTELLKHHAGKFALVKGEGAARV